MMWKPFAIWSLSGASLVRACQVLFRKDLRTQFQDGARNVDDLKIILRDVV